MTHQLENVMKHIQEFDKSRSLESLVQATQALEAADANAAGLASRIEQRQKVGRAWISILREIGQHLDPNFNPQDVPSMNIIPPAVGGVTYPSGVDPKSIPDPRARAQYEKQLEDNRRKAERYSFQYGLRKLDARAELGFQMFVERFYSVADRSELEQLLTDANLNAARREALLKKVVPQ